VAILPYKTAASAPFDCHIILGAVQNNISIVYSRLSFLPRKKREELNLFDEDASLPFINLHKFNSSKISAFFCSEQTFTGFEIPHSKIEAGLKPLESYLNLIEYSDYFSKDYFDSEKDFKNTKNFILHENQSNGFTEWKNRRKQILSDDKAISDVTLKYIQKKLTYSKDFPDRYSVSATALKTYYQCSLKWLFNRILNIDNVQIETSLMAEELSGTVYHTILDMFFSQLKEKNEILPKPVITENGLALPSSYIKLLQNCLDKIFAAFPLLESDDKEKNRKNQMSSLTMRFLIAAKSQFLFNLEKFLTHFFSVFSGCRIKNTEAWYQSIRDKYFLNGKSDCILEDKNGNYIIIDFKLGSPPKRKDCIIDDENNLCDFQLPMYITLAEENEKIEIHTALFFSIIKLIPEVIFGTVHDEIKNINYPKKEEDRIIRSSEMYNMVFSEFEDRAKQFADEIISGKFSVFEKDTQECFKCRYNRICRRVYTIKGEKNISLGKS